jgi:hypothetical protein
MLDQQHPAPAAAGLGGAEQPGGPRSEDDYVVGRQNAGSYPGGSSPSSVPGTGV